MEALLTLNLSMLLTFVDLGYFFMPMNKNLRGEREREREGVP